MYTKIGVGDSIPVFSPPLGSNPDLTDISPDTVSSAPMEPAGQITGLLEPITGRPLGTSIDGIASGASSSLSLPVQAPSSGRRRRCQTTNSTANTQDKLIISTDPKHSAQILCQSTTSSGPDFISMTEGLFCDMDVKQLWPLCSSINASSSCFDTTSNTLLTGAPYSSTTMGNTFLATSGIISKTYDTVTQWD